MINKYHITHCFISEQGFCSPADPLAVKIFDFWFRSFKGMMSMFHFYFIFRNSPPPSPTPNFLLFYLETQSWKCATRSRIHRRARGGHVRTPRLLWMPPLQTNRRRGDHPPHRCTRDIIIIYILYEGLVEGYNNNIYYTKVLLRGIIIIYIIRRSCWGV